MTAIVLCFLALPALSRAQDVDKSFIQNYDTALVICNRSTGAVTTVNPVLSARRLPPCSTFKIYNTLIGLELGLLKGPDDPWYRWNGVKRFLDAWNRDLTLREAFRVSCVPAYQALAREIGPERMQKYIDEIGYGTRDISAGIDTFWLPRPDSKPLTISVDEQVALLNKLLDGKLPFSEETIATLRDIMQVAKTDKGTLYGKTGSGTDAAGKADLGWFVGFLESNGKTYSFACSITGGDNPSGKIARGIVEDVFRSKGLFGDAGPARADLQAILDTEWRAFTKDKTNFTGGLALQILSPQGDCFLSTGMGDDMKNDRHFRIASVTKTFTAAGIMLLDQRGALRIDDKITDMIPGKDIPYVPDTPEYAIPYKDKITIRMLLMHRAGVFDQSNNPVPENEYSRALEYVGKNYLEYMLEKDPEHTFTIDELVGVNARNHLSFFEPGTAYHYSDTGYSILGKIIERVSGKSYGDFVRDELLVPNGLSGTGLVEKGADQDLPEPFVRGYVWMKGTPTEVTRSNLSPHVAEGNIYSTPFDLATWCKKLLKGEAGLTKETVGMMMKGMVRDMPNSEYGLGLVSFPATGYYGHGGAHEGYLTMMYYNPSTDVAYVIFTNVWDAGNGMDSIKAEFKLMADIAERVIAKKNE